MSFLFKRNKHKNAKDGLGLGIHPAPSADDYTPNKLRKNVRRHSYHRTSASAGSLSRSRSVGSLSGNGNQTGMADMVLDPCQYAEMLLQASAVRGHQQHYGSYRPSTPPPDPSYGTELEVPPPTPFHQNTIRGMRDYQSRLQLQQQSADSKVPRGPGNRDIAVDTILEGVTYDAILASTVNRTLGMNQGKMVMMDDGTMEASMSPETRVPPNSPAATVHRRRRGGGERGGGGGGGFGSLVGLTIAIMESRVPTV